MGWYSDVYIYCIFHLRLVLEKGVVIMISGVQDLIVIVGLLVLVVFYFKSKFNKAKPKRKRSKSELEAIKRYYEKKKS